MDWLLVFVNLVLTGILLYVFQKVIDERSEKRLEKFRFELRSTGFEKETKFSKLHENRFQVLLELDKKVSQINKDLSIMLFILKDDRSDKRIWKMIDDFQEGIKSFREYINEYKLYLPYQVYVKLFYFYVIASGIESDLSMAYINYDYANRTGEDPGRYVEASNEKLLSGATGMKEKLPPLIKELEEEFRALIGSAE